MSDKVDTRVSPSIDPETWRSVEGYTEETAPFDGGTVSVMNDAYVTLGKVHEARQRAEENPAWTPENRVLIVGKEAEKQKLRILQKVDRADRDLTANIAHTEKQLMEPLQERAGLGSLNTEIRAHVKALNPSDREKFMREALDRDDEITLTAVLGGVHYLSGMTPLDREHWLRSYHQKRRPELVRRLDLMKRLSDRLGSIAPIIHRQFEKAIGAKPGVVWALQLADDRARAALNIEPA